jgi:hypothetical protein
MTGQPLDPAGLSDPEREWNIRTAYSKDRGSVNFLIRLLDAQRAEVARLAEVLRDRERALTAERAKVQRVRDAYNAWQHSDDTPTLLKACVALAGEGAADQPQGEWCEHGIPRTFPGGCRRCGVVIYEPTTDGSDMPR